MIRHLACALVLGLLATTTLPAQTIRFDTNVGTFDMRLNPTGNPNLQGHVDNMLAYVEAGRYDTTVINRGVGGFILQMGGFQASTLSLPTSFDQFPSVPRFDPVVVESDNNNNITEFDATGLTNSRGTVTLALSNRGFSVNGQTVGVPNVSSGTSSFFVNLADNSSLDPGAMQFNNDVGAVVPSGGFIPFAEISDMATIDLIMALPQANLDTTGDNLGARNIPILEDNHLVFIERAFIVPTPQTMSQSNSSVTDSVAASSSSEGSIAADLAVPEPNTLLLAAGALMLLAARNRKRGV